MSKKDTRDIQQTQSADISGLMNPFPGLRPFGIEEAHLFFGREGQSDEVLSKLEEHRFVSILGASGSGKSSFMYCGLVPSLVGGFMNTAGSNWRVVVARPGGGPIENLAEALLVKDKDYNALSEEDQLIKKTIISTVLKSSSLGLVDMIRQLKTEEDQNILIVIDQFEELFRFRKLESQTSDLDESSAFVNLLLEAIYQQDESIYVTITMRSDFIGECAKFPDLTQMINDSHYLIPQMTRDQKREAIEGPVAVGGGKISARLSQQLLNDVGDNPDQLPILQHALMRTWSYWVENRRDDELMDVRHYNAIGTLKEALSQHANEAYDALSKKEKDIAEVMFKALTERGNENQGIRRPTKMGTIAKIAEVSKEEVIRVVDRFREPGRSLLMPPYGVKIESDTVIDISHESLMRIWDRLKRWLDEESQAADMYLKLSEAAERFQEGKASLWKMPDLQLALNWKEENRPTLVWGQRYHPAFERTMVFLETSEKAYATEQRNNEILAKRKVRAMRITAVVLGLATLVCLFLVVLSRIQANEADRQTILAKQNADLAEEKSQEAAIAADSALAAKFRAEAASEDARLSAIEATIQKDSAQAARLVAEDKTQAALLAQKAEAEQTELALKAQAEAIVQRDQATLARKRADQLKFQSIAQSMAIKATKIESDKELRGVVARQGFDFHEEYRDPAKNYNGDIHAGAYYGLQGLMDKRYLESDERFEGDSLLNQYVGHFPVINQYGQKQQVGVRSVAYSNDGSKLYSAGSDGRVLVWDMTNDERQYRQLFKRELIIRVLELSPDGQKLVIGTSQNNLFVIDLSNPNASPLNFGGHEGGRVIDIAFINNDQFVTLGTDGRLLKNIISNAAFTEVTRFTQVSPKTISISPDKKTLAIGSDNGQRGGEVYLFSLDGSTDNLSKIYTRNQGIVNALHFNHAGTRLAIGDDGGQVVIWDLEQKRKWGVTLTGFIGPITDVQFSPDDNLLLASSQDRTARMWDLQNIYDLPTVFDDHKNWIYAMDFHPNGDRFVTAADGGKIRLFYTKAQHYADQICGLISENMTDTEWQQYVGDPNEIEYEYTCPDLPKGVEAE